jgi:hypothetical protein
MRTLCELRGISALAAAALLIGIAIFSRALLEPQVAITAALLFRSGSVAGWLCWERKPGRRGFPQSSMARWSRAS